MRNFAKPRVVVSKCIEFEACRYNGELLHDETVQQLEPFVDYIPICPEVEIGLGTPRDTIRIVEINGVERLIQPSTGMNLTDKMNAFSENFLASLTDVDGFILKNRSPSCGTRDVKIYSNNGKMPVLSKGSGMFGRKVLAQFGHAAVEEEGRLKNFTIREHFFIKLFTLAHWRKMKEKPTYQKLQDFQASNKYLFMTYSQTKLKELGRIVAEHRKIDLEIIYNKYEQLLYQLLSKTPQYRSHVNTCQHIFGYYSKSLSDKERKYFLDLLDKYVDKKVPLSAVVSLLKSWAIRFNQEYLLSQTYFEPYPEELVAISDSGKGRDY
ncbi:DUF523 and DUF1722 domain-containing protein [Bacillus sp. RG28]|uniref:DUF523 and DUF1722 domain-containing protein n=1 Tax=Gottfriedia endophytica TaxID=2820819 RepID=A0A940NJJ7_9BACI|nr:DUF523 and DUF1722 domain-containing protein [Gottfriedia endophytica]MBP0726489.1 DUF523 and DUF1722 domain-containing protein [Gottfriedia endophytica]